MLFEGLRGSQEEVQDMFTGIDADGNGEISLDEYLRYWEQADQRNNPETEMLVMSLKPFRDIAAVLPRGS